MRAISIQQPWSWLVVYGYKDIENRTWATKIRGDVLIHAGKKFDAAGYAWVRAAFPHIPLPAVDAFQRGGIIGRVTVVDCVETSTSPWFEGPKGFLVANAAPLPFTPLRGLLGFFTVPDEVAVALGAVRTGPRAVPATAPVATTSPRQRPLVSRR